eukprot:scaffold4641_cov117-Isochrysis_galbana.AAC.13
MQTSGQAVANGVAGRDRVPRLDVARVAGQAREDLRPAIIPLGDQVKRGSLALLRKEERVVEIKRDATNHRRGGRTPAEHTRTVAGGGG